MAQRKVVAAPVTPRADLQLVEQRESLQKRLEDGFFRIEQAEMAGVDVAEWESFWMKLLREYEVVCRELDIAA